VLGERARRAIFAAYTCSSHLQAEQVGLRPRASQLPCGWRSLLPRPQRIRFSYIKELLCL